MNTIVHITTRTDWQAAQRAGEYQHPSLTTDGYIHCSLPTEGQLLMVANAYFAGQPDLVLLVMDRQRLTAPVQDEEFENSGLFFPHVYGSINAAAVLQVLDFLPQADGSFTLPTALSGTHNTAEQEKHPLPRTLVP
ncbi:DUF952 domain-containing protein [Deinococcus marmoris]|uniref:Glutathione S-transferase domain protein n=1 Tax=Deinococcus marmoris TaxID=249408 RepID=A0A1U7P0S1_9DEIO|nr:DUF952 domain-containing protein [Deinococcus marmoris]OLV18772.1 hypothetical protein BOO71_0004693 [Deinococcus marmoris]